MNRRSRGVARIRIRLAGGASVLWHVLALLAFGCTTAACAASAWVDDAGHSIELQAAPQRIVSLQPALTELVCALGACERLVGVDRYSSWPRQVDGLPKVGGVIDPDIESIVALEPDLVITAATVQSAARLRALGLAVAGFELQRRADVERVSRLLAGMLALGSAEGFLQRLELGILAATETVPQPQRGQRVYFEVSPGPYAAGADSFIGQMLQTLHLVNIVGGKLGPFPRINPELVVRSDPDVIMVTGSALEDLLGRPGWRRLRALATGHVCLFDAGERDILVRPGPRMADAAALLADCVAGRRPRNSDAGRSSN